MGITKRNRVPWFWICVFLRLYKLVLALCLTDLSTVVVLFPSQWGWRGRKWLLTGNLSLTPADSDRILQHRKGKRTYPNPVHGFIRWWSKSRLSYNQRHNVRITEIELNGRLTPAIIYFNMWTQLYSGTTQIIQPDKGRRQNSCSQNAAAFNSYV